jgi:hypothetical protein
MLSRSADLANHSSGTAISRRLPLRARLEGANEGRTVDIRILS